MKYLTLFMACIICYSCGEDNPQVVEKISFNFPSDCSINMQDTVFAIEGILDLSEFGIYSPTVFSPEVHGASEFLDSNQSHFPQTNDQIEKISLFQVLDQDENIVFERKDFEPNNSDLGWDGMINGELAEGGFKSIIQFRTQSQSLIQVEYFICALKCRMVVPYMDAGLDLRFIRWPSQHDGSGAYEDTFAPNASCF